MSTHATDERVVKVSEPTKEKKLFAKIERDAVQKQACAFCKPDTHLGPQKAVKTVPKMLSKLRFSEL